MQALNTGREMRDDVGIVYPSEANGDRAAPLGASLP
jgi:hypothetical protein